MPLAQPPTGIIRTLPSLYADKANVGHRAYQRTMANMESDPEAVMFIALAQQPKHDLLHLYILIGGVIEARFNLLGYEPGDSRKCWDKTIRQPKVWAACAGPISRPPQPIRMRGFQGFRYTSDLW